MALAPEKIAVGELGHDDVATRLMFRVSGLYGLGRSSFPVPISEHETVDSGQLLMTLDPEADASANVGVVDFAQGTMRMRNGVQVVFPGLHQVVKAGKIERSLLNPPRGIAITDARIPPDYAGWEAQSCLEFLPGSMWSGAAGG